MNMAKIITIRQKVLLLDKLPELDLELLRQFVNERNHEK